MNVELSKRSRELINAYMLQNYYEADNLRLWADSVDAVLLIEWLAKHITVNDEDEIVNVKKANFLLTSLRTQLLHDLHTAMNSAAENKDNTTLEEDNSWSTKAKFVLLIGAGVLLAACEGFDSINTLLSMFTSIPAGLILLVGLAFSALSIVVFCGFNLVQISTNLGMKLGDVPQLLDILLLQMREIKAIRRSINNSCLAEQSDEDLARFNKTLAMLKNKHAELVAASNEFKLALNGTKVRIATALFTGITGLMFLGGGFFAGQSVAVFMLGLVLTTVTPTALPVILFSLLVGVAAFSVYWYVERVGLRKLISGWFGLDEDKIDQLCDEEIVAREEKKLDSVINNITKTMRHRALSEITDEDEARTEITVNDNQEQTTPGLNRHSFYYHSANDSSISMVDSALSHAPGVGK